MVIRRFFRFGAKICDFEALSDNFLYTMHLQKYRFIK